MNIFDPVTQPVDTEQGLFTHLLTQYAQQSAVGGVSLPSEKALSKPPRPSSARKKLWEFSPAAACPITGVCLQWADLQRLCQKADLPIAGMTEYDIHVMATGECRRRSALAELVQRELDGRHRLLIQRAQAFKSDAELATWWDDAIADSNWSGVFWSLMTHPRCTAELESVVIGQVHMLQHQVGMANRVDMDKLNAVMAENSRTARANEVLQLRLQQQTTDQARQQELLQAEVSRLRADWVKACTERDQLQLQWQAMPRSEEWPQIQALRNECAEWLAENRRLRHLLAQMQEQVASAPLPGTPSRIPSGLSTGSDGAVCPQLNGTPVALHLDNRAVLCVGGRQASVVNYRTLVEGKGARFFHHDGGQEDRQERLGMQLQAADLVICQVGCISHNAYWRVKEHCKRTGKPCLFLESASKSSLERVLTQWASAAEPDRPQA